LHNANGWAAGIVLVDFYRHDRTAEYLPLSDGVFNWTKHFVWTRNEFADVPSSPFAIGGTLSAAFLLDYYFAFKNDPERSARAREAVELARKVTYRYMPAWACDNDRDDNLDASPLLRVSDPLVKVPSFLFAQVLFHDNNLVGQGS
jgi:hypothetical protein